MDNPAFLYIDQQPITLDQIIRYLHTSRNLGSFIDTILRQHILAQALAENPDAQVNPEQIDQVITSIRQEHQITDDQAFQQWLAQQGITEAGFRNDLTYRLKLQRFMPTVVEPRLQDAFMNQKLHLDQVILSRLVVDSPELAEELKAQILEEGANFEQLVREYSVASDRAVNGMMGAISRGDLSDGLRAVIDAAQPGDLVGPLEFENQWFLFRVEQFIPASLSDQGIQASLQKQIFDQWIADQIQGHHVELQLVP